MAMREAVQEIDLAGDDVDDHDGRRVPSARAAHGRRRTVLSRAVDHADDRRARFAGARADDHSAAERAVPHDVDADRRGPTRRSRAVERDSGSRSDAASTALRSLRARRSARRCATRAGYCRSRVVLVVAGFVVHRFVAERLPARDGRRRVRARLLDSRRNRARRDRPPASHRGEHSRDDAGDRRAHRGERAPSSDCSRRSRTPATSWRGSSRRVERDAHRSSR